MQVEQKAHKLNKSIAVITFYSAQKHLIGKKLLELPDTSSIKVKTVDAFQVRTDCHVTNHSLSAGIDWPADGCFEAWPAFFEASQLQIKSI